LQLRLVKLAARVIEFETQIKIHLPSSAPEQAIFATLLHRLPYLVTSSYGIRIGEVRILSPTPAMIIVGVTVSTPVV
jgi:hypothetical protein